MNAEINVDRRIARLPLHPESASKPMKEGNRAMAERAKRLANAVQVLADLASDELVDVLLSTVDRRRLDAEGNQTDPPGLYMAAVTAIIQLIDPGSLNEHDSLLADRLAAVGRGARLRISKRGEFDSVVIREIAEFVDAAVNSANYCIDDDVEMLALTFEKRFGKVADRRALRRALQNGNRNGRITEVCIALGLLDGGELRANSLIAVRNAISQE